MARPDWDTYFMNIASVVSERSNCSRRKVAAIIVSDRRILTTGYNGTPRGLPNCDEGGCPRCAGGSMSGARLSDCICAHAEENAIVQAAFHGISIRGAMLYSTLRPCLLCAKMIINAGISEVVYGREYTDAHPTSDLLDQAGLICRKFDTT